MLELGRSEPPNTILTPLSIVVWSRIAIGKLVIDEELELLHPALWGLAIVPHAHPADCNGRVEDDAHSVDLA